VTSTPPKKLRVLVVDDSRIVRHVITDALSASTDIQVVGHASNGEQALRMVAELDPDAITLDLEMPKMGGFTFLRLLLARRSTPVIVLSTHDGADNVFKALELGAVDFIPKPQDPLLSPEPFRTELIQKVLMTRHLVQRPRPSEMPPRRTNVDQPPPSVPPRFLVVVASSTGGPTALLHMFSRFPPGYPGAVLVAQHMAPNFTRTFAERLDRVAAMTVREATDGELVLAGRAYVCPGGSCMSIRKLNGFLLLDVRPPAPTDRYVPSANRLFTSAADVFGARAHAVILTGMADDGVVGATSVRRAGGTVLVESEETAVVYGMPGAAVRAGVASKVLPLHEIANAVASLGSTPTPT
jgi:two-component system chemotaxis response regulator CheB